MDAEFRTGWVGVSGKRGLSVTWGEGISVWGQWDWTPCSAEAGRGGGLGFPSEEINHEGGRKGRKEEGERE